MLRSLFSGISGLRAHQAMMDVTGNNIANVNTTGFKSSQTVFQDTMSQMLKAAGVPQGGNAGTNPSQVGLGTRVAAVTTNFGQGSAQTTGRSTDLMIQGDGFFAVDAQGETLFTRSGAFSFDTDGNLSTSDGGKVQGWSANNGVVNTNVPVGAIVLPVGDVLDPKATDRAKIAGNLPVAAATGTIAPTSIKIYDAKGVESDMALSFTKRIDGDWDVATTSGALTATGGGPILPIKFTDGSKPDLADFVFTPAGPPIGAPIAVDVSGLTSFDGATATATAVSQSGFRMGSLQAFSLSPDGTLIGVFSSGRKENLAQVALSTFNNPGGLEKVGGSMFRTTVNSGLSQMGAAGSGGRGLLASGTLEMSNVDLAQEFTNLIVAQRGFQANSRVITTSDSILEDLVNLKR